MRLHHGALAASARSAPLLRSLRDAGRGASAGLRDLCGTNLAALRLLKRQLAEDGAAVEMPDWAEAAAPKSKAAAPPGSAKKRQKKKAGK